MNSIKKLFKAGSGINPNAMLKCNPRFNHYKKIFDDLLKETRIMTQHPIMTCTISYDSTRAICVTKKGERENYIQMFDLESF
jgi:hypothetical protein